MTIREQFTVPKRFNTVAMALMAIGILAIIGLYVTHGSKSDEHEQARFLGQPAAKQRLLLLVVNAAMFLFVPLH